MLLSSSTSAMDFLLNVMEVKSCAHDPIYLIKVEQVDKKMAEYDHTKTEAGLRQGCISSPVGLHVSI